MAKEETFYLITYRNPKDNEVVELKAKSIADSSLGLAFVCISDFVFNSSTLVVNPSEDAQRKKFEGVKTLHINIYSIISVEEVGPEHKGLSFDKDRSNLVVLPNSSNSPN